MPTDPRPKNCHDDDGTQLGDSDRPVHAPQANELHHEAADADKYGRDGDELMAKDHPHDSRIIDGARTSCLVFFSIYFFALISSVGCRDQLLWIFGENSKRFKSLIAHGCKPLQPDDSCLPLGSRSVSFLRRAAFNHVRTK